MIILGLGALYWYSSKQSTEIVEESEEMFDDVELPNDESDDAPTDVDNYPDEYNGYTLKVDKFGAYYYLPNSSDKYRRIYPYPDQVAETWDVPYYRYNSGEVYVITETSGPRGSLPSWYGD